MWKEIISFLMRSGMTQQEIASAVGISQAHVSDLANGKRGSRLGYEIGKRLHELRAKQARRQKRIAS